MNETLPLVHSVTVGGAVDQNLMHSAPESSKEERLTSPKRIWDVADTEKFNQFSAIFGSRFLRPF